MLLVLFFLIVTLFACCYCAFLLFVINVFITLAELSLPILPLWLSMSLRAITFVMINAVVRKLACTFDVFIVLTCANFCYVLVLFRIAAQVLVLFYFPYSKYAYIHMYVVSVCIYICVCMYIYIGYI